MVTEFGTEEDGTSKERQKERNKKEDFGRIGFGSWLYSESRNKTILMPQFVAMARFSKNFGLGFDA